MRRSSRRNNKACLLALKSDQWEFSREGPTLVLFDELTSSKGFDNKGNDTSQEERAGAENPAVCNYMGVLECQNVAAPQHSCQPLAVSGCGCLLSCREAALLFGPELCFASDLLWNVLGWEGP